MEIKRINFDAKFSNFEKINSQFAKVKIHVLYTGKNRNRSDISYQTVEQMIPSLFNVPVVGEWIEENNNFGGHGGKLEISDKGIDFIDTTKPYGVVPSDSEIKWETVREKDGITEHQYLTCTAYLWYKRYPEIEKILDDGAGQSMEINISKYHEDDEGYLVIDEAEFSALCILGRDTNNPDNHYEPCFEGAKITSYSLNKDLFKKEFAEMINELKYSLQNDSNNTEEGGSVMENEDIIIQDKMAKETTEKTIETIEMEKEETKEEVMEIVIDKTIVENDLKVEENFEEVKQQYEDRINELEGKLNELQSKYNDLEKDNMGLKEFKQNILDEQRKAEEKDIFSQFEKLNGDEEFEILKKDVKKYSIEQLQEKCFAILGRKSTNFSVKPKIKTVKVNVPEHNNDKVGSPYGDLFDRYNK